MEAYYYCIRKNDTKKVVDEGIIENDESIIYPNKTSGIKDLPDECECYNFFKEGYTITGFYFDIPYKEIIKYKTPE